MVELLCGSVVIRQSSYMVELVSGNIVRVPYFLSRFDPTVRSINLVGKFDFAQLSRFAPLPHFAPFYPMQSAQEAQPSRQRVSFARSLAVRRQPYSRQ